MISTNIKKANLAMIVFDSKKLPEEPTKFESPKDEIESFT